MVIESTEIVKVTLTPVPLDDPALQAMRDEGSKMLAHAQEMVIKDPASAKLASADLSVIAGVKKRMAAKKAEYTAPVRTLLTNLNTAFDSIMEHVMQADTILRDKVKTYIAEKERQEAEQRQIVRDQIALAERARALEDSGGETVELEAVDVTVVEAPVRVRSDMGMVSKKANWKYRVIDISQVPREYLVVDNAQLTAIARKHHDQKQIAGIEFWNDETIQVRHS